MLKSIAIPLLSAFLFQGCVVYQSGSTPIAEAQYQGKVKIENTNGMSWTFLNIEQVDDGYYGIKKKNKMLINEELVASVFLKDIDKSKKKTRRLAIGIGIGIPVAFVASMTAIMLIFVNGQASPP